MLKDTEVALAGITSSSNGGISKHRSKEDDDDEDEEEEEGSVHDDSDEWSEEGDNLLKVCNIKNINYLYLYYRSVILCCGICVLYTQ